MKLIMKRGQSIGEYAILFAIVLGAVIAMQSYIRNRIANRLKTAADGYDAGTTSVATTSDSTSTTRASMSRADTGTVGGTTSGTSTTQGLP